MNKADLILQSNNWLMNKEDVSTDKLIQAFEDEWINETLIASILSNILLNAEKAHPKWWTIEDFETKLSAVKTWHKIKTNQPDMQVNIANIFPTNSNLL